MLKRIKQLDDGRVLCMSELSDVAWALENGFSADLHEVEQLSNGDYYLAGQLPQLGLDELKLNAKLKADQCKDASLITPAILDVSGVGGVLYNQQAILNVSSLLVLDSADATNFILADDSVVALVPHQIRDIAYAFKAHVDAIYAKKLADFAAIDAASGAEDLVVLGWEGE